MLHVCPCSKKGINLCSPSSLCLSFLGLLIQFQVFFQDICTTIWKCTDDQNRTWDPLIMSSLFFTLSHMSLQHEAKSRYIKFKSNFMMSGIHQECLIFFFFLISLLVLPKVMLSAYFMMQGAIVPGVHSNDSLQTGRRARRLRYRPARWVIRLRHQGSV